MILDTILWRLMLRRDPLDTLFKASMHILETHEVEEPGVGDALRVLWQARQAICDDRSRQILQTLINQG